MDLSDAALIKISKDTSLARTIQLARKDDASKALDRNDLRQIDWDEKFTMTKKGGYYMVSFMDPFTNSRLF